MMVYVAQVDAQPAASVASGNGKADNAGGVDRNAKGKKITIIPDYLNIVIYCAQLLS